MTTKTPTCHSPLFPSLTRAARAGRAASLTRCIAATAIVAATVGQSDLKAATCFVNGTDYKQIIAGIGGSTAWCGTLTTAQNDNLYNTLGFSLNRIRIDPNMNWSSETANASAAHARGAKVMGTPWTPPASMKNNNNVVGGKLNTSQYANYASYLNQAANSIGLDYVSIQNEPDITVTYESCTWTATDLLNFCRNNAQNIGRPVIMPESFNFNDSMSDPTLNDSLAASRVSIVGGHIYGGGLYVHQNALNKGKQVWMTEHYRTGTDMATACAVAKEMNDCFNNQMHAYFWWWVNSSSAPVGERILNQTNPTKSGYAMGQFAKWVRPGKQRIGATYNPTSGVYVTAYRNNGLVIVAVNTTGSAVNQTFTLQNMSGVSSLIVHRTSSSQNMANVGNVTVSNNSFTSQMPAQSISTYHQF